MSYYTIKVEALRTAGCVVEELGDEVAVARSTNGDDTILIGGDSPTALGSPRTITADEAREVAALARTPLTAATAAAWETLLDRLALAECRW